MHTLSLRAFRSAALSLQKSPLATRSGRLFHASAPVRAADDSGSGPRDDGSKPERENGAGEGDNGDFNLFGENTSTTNGESHGRKKAGNGTLRSRTIRNRKPEELPPVSLPKSFLSSAIVRLGDTQDDDSLNRIYERDVRTKLESTLFNLPQRSSTLATPPIEWTWEELIGSIFDETAWREETLREALDTLAVSPDENSIHRRGDILVAAALWAAALSVREAYGKDAADRLLENNSVPGSIDLLGALTYGRDNAEADRPLQRSQVKQIIDKIVNDPPLGASPVSWFEGDMIEDIVASVNTDLLVQAPKNVVLADLRRPVTIINTTDYTGYTVPRDIVRHVASKLGADVLHLRASDIAHIVGSYLGQDPVRAPGTMSQMGYKAAEISGRLTVKPNLFEDSGESEDVRVPYTIVMRDDRHRKENKRYTNIMDAFLNGTNRGKSDELWEDLKVNTAIEELIYSVNSESTEQRPLIVHVDDFNALNLDLECGALVLSKIRKVVDGLWADGRKIALVGSCSTRGARIRYYKALRDLESTERVKTLRLITLHSIEESIVEARSRKAARCRLYERYDYIEENERNIARVLSSMVEPPSEAAITTTGKIGLSEIDLQKLPVSWTNSVLPLAEIDRIVTTMIGYSKDLADVFTVKAIEKAAEVIKKLEHLAEKHRGITAPSERPGRKESPGFVDVRNLNPTEENHEDRLESGLVNAGDIRTTFKDVHAPKETIESVKMLTTLSLIRPEAFSYGVLANERIPGCLLYGPPGTGKTLLAKAVAKESGANMIEISGASINNKYVGESEKSVRALFELAKKKEPLVIFIDEADALLGSRGRRDLGSRRETINQFLREWDGMDKTKAFIMVATNRPFDLDEAVLRRLPRKLLIDLPLEQDRAAILRIHLKDEMLDEESVSVEDIAKRTPLYSGSDLKNVCVAAAMAAVKEELELEEQQKQQAQLSTEQPRGAEEGKGVSGNSNHTSTTSNSQKRRVLAGRHFDKALQEIGASVSEDMATLTAIRKFDEKYGDSVGMAGGRRRKRKGMGFEVAADAAAADAEAKGARVRSGR